MQEKKSRDKKMREKLSCCDVNLREMPFESPIDLKFKIEGFRATMSIKSCPFLDNQDTFKIV
jgi:hypothetical protein